MKCKRCRTDDLCMHHSHLWRMKMDAEAALLRTTRWGEPYQQFHFWRELWSREQLERLAALTLAELSDRFPVVLPGPESDFHGSTIPR